MFEHAMILKDNIGNKFYRRPFIYFVVFLMAGVLWGEGTKIPPVLPGVLAIGLLLAGIWLSGLGKRRERLALALSLAFFFLGWMRIRQAEILPPEHIANFFSRDLVTVEGILARPVQHFKTRTRLFLSVEKISQPIPYKGFKEKEQKACGLIQLDTRIRLPLLKYGDRIRVRTRLKQPYRYRNPGVFDYRTYLQRKGIFRKGWIKSEKDVIHSNSSPSLMRTVFNFRNRFFEFVGNDTQEKQFLHTVMLGMREVLPYQLKDSFVRTGSAHLLAISGLHIGILAWFFYLFFCEIWRLLPFRFYLQLTRKISPRKFAAILSIPPLVGYTLLVGSATSTVRAMIMILAYFVAKILERDKDYFNVLAVAAAVIILWRPVSIREVDFQLSFVIVFFIIYILNVFEKRHDPLADEPGRIEKISTKIRTFFLLTLSAYLASLPLVSYHFKQLSLVGILGNLLAVPLFSLILPVGILGLIFFPVSRTLSGIFVMICLKGASLMLGWIKALGKIEWSSVMVYQPPIILVLVIYGFYLCLARVNRYRGARYGAGAFFLLGLLLVYPVKKDNRLQISFLDVGQGDATFIRTPQGKTLLIDAGGGPSNYSLDAGKAVVAPFLLYEWIKHLDLVILSHPHHDHYGGMPYIMENFSIGEFWDTTGGFRSDSFKHKMEKNRLLIRNVAAGNSFDLDRDLRLEVLHPPKLNSYKTNDRSIVLRLIYKNVTFLFTGDIEEKAEADLVATGADLAAMVLKIPHHGANTSNSVAFIRAVQPDYAVLFRSSYPKSNYTNWGILRRYRDLGIRILETGREGCVTFYSDGNTLWLETARGTRAIKTMIQ
jgi:competence protein ComEC